MPSASNLKALKKSESLREVVARSLRAAIVSGEMEPGKVYSAPTLCTRFGVSATPVREAMLDLIKEGMATPVPNKGFRVTEVSDADLDHITELRLLIEPPVIRRIVDVVPDGDFARLRVMAQDIVDFAVAGQLAEYVEADRLFHLELLGYNRNPRLVDTISQLRTQTRLLGLAPLVDNGELRESAEEHLSLVDLIAVRDADAAEALMRRHIGHVRGKWAGPDSTAPQPRRASAD